jgi:hypothetical protein
MRRTRRLHAVEQQFAAVLKKYEQYPDKKAKVVQENGYIKERFGDEWSMLQQRLLEEPELAEQIHCPLEAQMHPALRSAFFRYKLLLRDNNVPPLAAVLAIKEELVLPPGITVNPESKKGLYWLSVEGQEILDKARTLFITATFTLSSGAVITEKVPLDLLMATPAYTDSCKQFFAESIIQPNIVASRAAFEKQKADLIRMYDMTE